MSGMVTDTIIVTSKTRDACQENVLQYLQNWLSETILLSYQIDEVSPIQLINLKKFDRSLIIAPNREIAQAIMQLFQNNSNTNNNNDGLAHYNLQSLTFNYSTVDSNMEIKYLDLPKHDKLFLISPPSSPPPEFDYSRCEDIPNKHPHIHLKKFGTQISDYNNNTDSQNGNNIYNNENNNNGSHFTLLTSDIANITVDSCELLDDDSTIKVDEFKTMMPPRSIFDDD